MSFWISSQRGENHYWGNFRQVYEKVAAQDGLKSAKNLSEFWPYRVLKNLSFCVFFLLSEIVSW